MTKEIRKSTLPGIPVLLVLLVTMLLTVVLLITAADAGRVGVVLLLALAVAFAAIFGRVQPMVFGETQGKRLPHPPALLPVHWSAKARAAVNARLARWPTLDALIEEVLAQDPRPAYQDDPAREYGVRLYDCNVRFIIADGVASVLDEIGRASCRERVSSPV